MTAWPWLVHLALLAAAPHPGFALLDGWQLEGAAAAAEAELFARPESAPAQLLAAEVLHQRGAHLTAWSLLQGIDAAEREARWRLVAPRLAGAATYAGGFTRQDSAHFSVRAMDKDEVMARLALPVLEAAYTRIGAALAFLPAEGADKIVVEIYPDARGLAGATGLTVKEIETSGTIAVCKYHRLMVTSPLATAQGYRWADTLAHEFVHLVVSKRSHNSVPIWLHEGIAKYFESLWRGPVGAALDPYGEQLLAAAVKNNSFIPLAKMHPSMAKLPSQEDAALAFAEVFTLVEHLEQRFGLGSIAGLLRRLGAGEPLEEALSGAFGLDLAGLERAWHRGLKSRPFRPGPRVRPRHLKLALGGAEAELQAPLEPFKDKPLQDAARLGELLALRHQPAAAVREFEHALALGGQAEAGLVNRLVMTYADLERWPEAEALVAQSLAAHPDDAEGHMLAGRLARRRAAWAEVERHFEAVLWVNPFVAEAHAGLAEAYAHRQDGPRAEAARAAHAQCLRRRGPLPAGPPPAPPPDSALLRAVPPMWRGLRLDGAAVADGLLWDRVVSPGAHEVRYPDRSGQERAARIACLAGRRQRLALLP